MTNRLSKTFKISFPEGNTLVNVTGQSCRTLEALIEHEDGVSPSEMSVWGYGFRMSEYVRNLRHTYGLNIETVKVVFNAPYGKGWFGKYKLHTQVKLEEDE